MAGAERFTELTDYLHPILTTIDYTRPATKVIAVTLATLASVLICVITHAIFIVTSRVYQNLKLKEKVFWNLAVVRSVYGVFCITVGLWSIFGHTALAQDMVFATTATSHVVTAITVGFFIFECAALTLSDVYFKTFSGLLQLHHWISLFGFLVVLVTDAGHTMGCMGLMLEMSTPFSGICWTLLKADKERSLLWKANQFLLVHTFHLRNVVEMMLWYVTYIHWQHISSNMPMVLFLPLYLQLVLVTVFLTPYWTYKKTKQMICPVDWNFESAEVKINSAKTNGVASEKLDMNGNGYTSMNGSGLKQE